MKALIFNGALERNPNATAYKIAEYLQRILSIEGVDTQVFHVADSGIPLFDYSLKKTPQSVEIMNHAFRSVDMQIWLSPLYHGGMTGVMKNCLDWLEFSAKMPQPYLTGQRVGLVCWADGVQAMQGINAMDAVAKSLRAWTLPYAVPVQKIELLDEQREIAEKYQDRFGLLTQLLVHGPRKLTHINE